jgi:hypothetical protein
MPQSEVSPYIIVQYIHYFFHSILLLVIGLVFLYPRRICFPLHFFSMAQQPLESHGPPRYRGLRITPMTLTRYDLPVLVISPRDLCLTIHNTQKETDILAPVVIRTCTPTKQSAADPRLSL